MTSIEQAREALKPRALDALKNNQRQLDQDGCEVGVSRQALDELIAAYEVLIDPTTPVDGVGAEPGDVAWAKVRIDTVPDEHGWCSCTPYNKHPVDVAKGLATDEWNERGQFFGQVALANPEAEARLRERVDVEHWDIEATAQHIARELSSIPGGRYHEPTYNAAKAGAKEALKRAEATVAEARLAQAEGGPAVTGIERGLRALMTGEFSSLTIGFNDHHACNYVDAKGWQEKFGGYGGGEDELIDWASEEERQKAIDENSVWTIQWYPNTPVGFNCVGASTLAAAIEAALHPQSAAGEEGK